MTKLREWVLPLKTLILNDGQGLSAWARQDREDETRVVEYAAIEAERARSAKLIEAIKDTYCMRDVYLVSVTLREAIEEYEASK